MSVSHEKISKLLKTTALTAAAVIVCLPFVGAAHAEEMDFAIEEITVTATKRGALRLQDVPFAVQAISGDTLNKRGAVDFDDFFRLVPGLAVFDQGPGDKRIIIRGVNATGAGTVGLYLDEVIITGENAQDGGGRQPDIKLFDIERVEVLKGPQGTTFGSSSLSGTIRYITKKPDYDEIDASVRASLRNTKGGDLGWHSEGAISVPIVEGKAALRLAGYYLDEDGYIDNRFADGVNDEETYAFRGILGFQPTEKLSLSLMAMYQDMETTGPSFFNRIDFDGTPISQDGFFQADLTRNGFNDETQIYNGTAEYADDFGTITATASYFKRDTVFNRDSSLALAAFIGLDPETEGRSIISQPKNRELQTYEIRYASDFSGPLQVLAGAFYQNEERFFRSAILSAGSDGNIEVNPTAFLDRVVDTEVEEIAFFGELSWDVTDKLNLTGGVRYYDFDISEVATAVVGFGGGPGAGTGPESSSKEDGEIFKGNVSYDFNEDVKAYFQVAEGFRSGGTNDQTAAQIANVTIPAGFNSDSLVNYELGLKSQWANGRVTTNVAGYLIDWSDIQIQNQATDGQLTFPFRDNGGAAKITGVELEVSARPLDGWIINATANFADARLTRDNPIPSSGFMADIGGDVSYVSSRNTEFRPDSPLFVDLDDYALVNLRAGVTTETGWRASLVVKNVANNTTVVDVFRIVAGVTPDGFIINTPRTVVFSVSKNF